MVISAPDNQSPEISVDSVGVELAQAVNEAIGQVSAVDGTVTITRTDGTKVQAADGTNIFQGDLIETAADGAIGIAFADESTFSLAEKGSMVVDEMIYDPGSQSGKSVVSIAEGVFTFVSGHIAKTTVDAMVIKTPVAVIGIRGTEGGGRAGPEGTNNILSLFGGEMTIQTQGGTAVMNAPGQTTQMASSFVPPTRPVKLPPQALQRFYAKAAAVAPKPVFNQQTQPTNQQSGDPSGATEEGATQDGATDQGPVEEGAGAAEQAAADAFEQALAGGGSLDDALNAATNAAAETSLRETLAVNPDAFGTPGAVDSVMRGLVNDVLGTVRGDVGDPTDAGARPGLDRAGPVEPPPVTGPVFALPPPPSFPFPVAPPPRPPVIDDPDDPLPEGPDTIIATGGDDTFFGGGAATTFIADQAAGTLGGTDIFDGGNGIDEIQLLNLSDLQLIYNSATRVASYADSGSLTGEATLISVERVLAGDVEGNQTRESLDDTTGFAYILAGTTGDNTLSAANGQSLSNGSLSGVSGSTISTGNVIGSLIFGGAGNDTITGSEAGDVLFGGTGNDTITLGGVGSDDDEANGGAGDDTIIAINPLDLVDGSSNPSVDLDGGAGNDTLQLGSGSSGQTFTLVSGPQAATDLVSIEVLNLAEDTTTVKGSGANFFNNLTEIQAGAGSTVTATDGVLNLINVTVDADVTTLSATGGTPAVSITDSNQAIARTLVGGTGGDNLEGLGGGDTIQLNGGGGHDTNTDVVFYRNISDTGATAGGTTGFDVIQDFQSSTDQIVIRLNGSGFSAFDDVTADQTEQSAAVSTGSADLTAAEIVYITSTVGGGSLFDTTLTSVRTAIGTVNTNGGGAENDAIFVLNDGTDTGIYLYTSGDSDGTIQATELTALAQVSGAVLTESDGDISFSAT